MEELQKIIGVRAMSDDSIDAEDDDSSEDKNEDDDELDADDEKEEGLEE